MGLLDRLRGAPRFRPVIAGHAEIGPVLQSLIRRMDVTPARELFAATRGRWHLRWLVVTAVADHYVTRMMDEHRAAMMDGWVASTPDEPLAYLARALYHVEAAWHARGRGQAASVSDEGWRRFEAHMKATVPDCERAAELDPTDPTPHHILMGAAPGIYAADAARAGVERHYQDVLARAPDHHIAHRRACFLLSERWYGSHDESLALARRIAEGAPEGSELPMLLVAAHEITRSYVHFFDRDDAAATAYTRRPEVAGEIEAAYRRSLASPLHQPTDLTPYRRHEAALWFWVTGDKPRTRAELEHLGDLFDPDEDPWHVSSERYRAIRRELGL